MKQTIMTLALAAVCCLSAPAQERLFNSASVQSPIVNKDGTVTFNLYAPKAIKVEVTGDFLPTRPVEVEGYGKYDAPGVAELVEGKNGKADLRAYWDSKGYKYEYVETDGGHIWRNWHIYLTMFAQKIFK